MYNYLFSLSEIHRVLKHGGRFLVGVPYVTLTEYDLANPYHKNNFNEYSFDFFEPGRLLGSAVETSSIKCKKIFHRFHYLPEFESMSEKRKEWCRRHLFNVVRKIDFGLLALKIGEGGIDFESELPKQLAAEFDDRLLHRRAYTREERERRNESQRAQGR